MYVKFLLREFIVCAAIGVSVVVTGFAIFFAALMLAPVDSTDAGRFERSGMALRVDHGTGCHYLSRWLSAPVPRLDAAGSHVGCHGIDLSAGSADGDSAEGGRQ